MTSYNLGKNFEFLQKSALNCRQFLHLFIFLFLSRTIRTEQRGKDCSLSKSTSILCGISRSHFNGDLDLQFSWLVNNVRTLSEASVFRKYRNVLTVLGKDIFEPWTAKEGGWFPLQLCFDTIAFILPRVFALVNCTSIHNFGKTYFSTQYKRNLQLPCVAPYWLTVLTAYNDSHSSAIEINCLDSRPLAPYSKVNEIGFKVKIKGY